VGDIERAEMLLDVLEDAHSTDIVPACAEDIDSVLEPHVVLDFVRLEVEL